MAIKSCKGYNHVITVWRDFDPNTQYTFTNHVTYTHWSIWPVTVRSMGAPSIHGRPPGQ